MLESCAAERCFDTEGHFHSKERHMLTFIGSFVRLVRKRPGQWISDLAKGHTALRNKENEEREMAMCARDIVHTETIEAIAPVDIDPGGEEEVIVRNYWSPVRIMGTWH